MRHVAAYQQLSEATKTCLTLVNGELGYELAERLLCFLTGDDPDFPKKIDTSKREAIDRIAHSTGADFRLSPDKQWQLV